VKLSENRGLSISAGRRVSFENKIINE